MSGVSRYHPALVALHWLLAVLLLAMLGLGFFVLSGMPNNDPSKLGLLETHMAGGMLILALMIIRLFVHVRSAKPARATTGNRIFDRLQPVSHYGFYMLVALMVASGYTTGILAGLNRSVFQRTGEPLPADFSIFPSFTLHALLAVALAWLIVLHVGAALYHQFVLKDSLFRRMGFGRRSA